MATITSIATEHSTDPSRLQVRADLEHIALDEELDAEMEAYLRNVVSGG